MNVNIFENLSKTHKNVFIFNNLQEILIILTLFTILKKIAFCRFHNYPEKNTRTVLTIFKENPELITVAEKCMYVTYIFQKSSY